MTHDVFISHASEDKDSFVRPLAQELIDRDYDVWYDEFSLRLGDSLRRSIDKGLANSRYGIVVISHNFLELEKEWPQRELDGLTAMEIDGRKVILPIWHGVERSDILRYSPVLADKLAVKTSQGMDRVVRKIIEVLGQNSPDKTLSKYAQSDELSSDRAIDYTRLHDLLVAGQWEKADSETSSVMRQVVGRKGMDWITDDEMLNFPCTDLRTIDNLWVKYSNGRFGFSVQKKIYLKVGGIPDGKYYEEAWKKFSDVIGWRMELTYLRWDIRAPEGHLPLWVSWNSQKNPGVWYAMPVQSALPMHVIREMSGLRSLLSRPDL